MGHGFFAQFTSSQASEVGAEAADKEDHGEPISSPSLVPSVQVTTDSKEDAAGVWPYRTMRGGRPLRWGSRGSTAVCWGRAAAMVQP